MSQGLKIALIVIVVILLVLFIGINWFTRGLAIDTCTLEDDEIDPIVETPADYGMEFEPVSVITEDGFSLFGWYVPSENGANIMAMHGSPGGRQDELFEAEFLNRNGYGVLIPSFRAHDESDGNTVTFGYLERTDMDAWYDYLVSRDDVDEGKVGALGESMGGGTTILYAAENDEIRALVTVSAFALTPKTVTNFIEVETGLPQWLASFLARFIMFWAEGECDFDADAIDTELFIGDISPRPILIIQGLQDIKIDPNSGQALFDAANEPKELWEVERSGHVDIEEFEPEEYEQRVVEFFNENLLGE